MYLDVAPYHEILQGMLTALTASEGIVKLTGAPGTGKSVLCQELANRLRERGYPVVHFLHPPTSPEALQKALELRLQLYSVGNFTRALTRLLHQRPSDNQVLYLLFDDAEQFSDLGLDAVRLIGNIQNDSRTLVRSVLCGHDALNARLQRPAQRSLAQHLGQSFELTPMNLDQVRDFYWQYWRVRQLEVAAPSEAQLAEWLQRSKGLPGPLLAAIAGQHPAPVNARAQLEQTVEASVARPAPPPYVKPRNIRWQPYVAAAAVLAIGGYAALQMAGLHTAAPPDAAQGVPVQPMPPQALPPRLSETLVTAAEPAVAPPPVAEVAVVAEMPTAGEVAITPAVTTDVTVATPGEAPDMAAGLSVATDETTEAAETAVVTEAAEVTSTQAVEVAAEPEATLAIIAADAVTVLLQDWSSAWQRQDLAGYFQHYDAAYHPQNMGSRAEWEANRIRVIGQAQGIMISWHDLLIRSATAEEATVELTLDYSSATYADRTVKQLHLLRGADGRLIITDEINLLVERR